MKPPFGGRGWKRCCCCILDPDYTCYLIGAFCIVSFAFGSVCTNDINHLVEFIISIISFCYYLGAGLCLILGTLYMKKEAKFAYCWMMLVGIVLIIVHSVMVIVSIGHEDWNCFYYTLYGHRTKQIMYIIAATQFLFHILFSLLTPCIVLGNLDTYRKPPE